MISPERLYLTSDRSAVVKDGDPRATFLLVGAGCEIDIETAKRYGLTDEHVAAPVEPVAEPVAVADAPADPPADPPKPAPPKAPAFKPAPK